MASVSQVPELAEAVKVLAGRMVQADIPEPEAQYMLRAAIVLAALRRSRGRSRIAARYLGIPLRKFRGWLIELHLEQEQKDMRRIFAAQPTLRLRAAKATRPEAA